MKLSLSGVLSQTGSVTPRWESPVFKLNNNVGHVSRSGRAAENDHGHCGSSIPCTLAAVAEFLEMLMTEIDKGAHSCSSSLQA